MEKREKSNKDKSRFAIMMILIGILVLISLTMIILSIKALSEYIDDNSSYHDPDLPQEVMAIDDNTIENLISYIEGNIGDGEYSIIEYPDNILKMKRLDTTDKMQFTIRNVLPFFKENCVSTDESSCVYVLYDEFNQKYEEIFGEKNVSKEDILDGDKHWVYNEDENIYEIYGTRIIEENLDQKISKFVRAVKVGNMIEIYEYVSYTKESTMYEPSYSYTLHNEKLDVLITEENYLDNLNKMDLYRYMFMHDKNDNYVWVSLEYVKQ